ncbi:hypothetical protein CsSME_00022916 [Camellia sinensis var. sinensis]
MVDENGLELSLGLSLCCSSAKSNDKNDSSSNARTFEGDRSNKLINDFKNLLEGGNLKQEFGTGSQRNDPIKPNDFLNAAVNVDASKSLNGKGTWVSNVNKGAEVEEEKRHEAGDKRKNLFDEINNQKKLERESHIADLHDKPRPSHISITTDDGSTAENEDVADSEVEGSTSRLIPHHGDGTKKYIGDAIQTTNNSSVVDLQGQKRFTISSEKEFKDGNMPYGVPFPPQLVNIMNMPYPLDVKESSSFGVPGTSNYPQTGKVQAMAAANSKRPGTQPVMPGNFPVMFGYSPVQLPVSDKDDSWGLASHPQQLHPPFVGRLPPSSDKHNDGLKISQGSFSQTEDGVKGSNMIFGTKEESDKLRAEGFPYELSAIRPGIAAELKFGGCGSSPNLPWVSANGPGPNGRTISGVTFRFSATQIKIVCACHGSHMSPEEFVRHAGEEQTNPDSGSGLASLPSNNPAASALN